MPNQPDIENPEPQQQARRFCRRGPGRTQRRGTDSRPAHQPARVSGRRRDRRTGQGPGLCPRRWPQRRRRLHLRTVRRSGEAGRRAGRLYRAAQQPAPRVHRARRQNGQARAVRETPGRQHRGRRSDGRRLQSGGRQADGGLPHPVHPAPLGRQTRHRGGQARQDQAARQHSRPGRGRRQRVAAESRSGGRRAAGGRGHLLPQHPALPDRAGAGVGLRGACTSRKATSASRKSRSP